ncbi:MAG: hypothetical protein E7654_04455 [Ruminococcaceae bacterium]|nr:hypothetical protein [Oscillospiraceae bacterium]
MMENESLTPMPRKRRLGDRKDGRKLRTLPPILRVMPYIMKKRSDAQNTFADSFDITEADRMVRCKVKQGMTNFSLLHIILAAYVRMISQRPGVNRFVSGQKIYARNNIEIVMAVKREMSLDGQETMIKVVFPPDATVDEVYEIFNRTVKEAVEVEGETVFDKVARTLISFPGFFLRFIVSILFALDYVGWLPRFLLNVSPFHGTMIITSMGSLGIKPIYHHIYDFGNLPVFLSYGAKYTVNVIDRDGGVVRKRYVDIKAVTDERICDGYYYASALKMLKKLIQNPTVLNERPEEIIEDID